MIYATTLLMSVFITVSLMPITVKLATRYQMVDFPNPRKVHVRPVPRIGGLAMAAGAFLPIIIWMPSDQFVRAFMASTGTLVLFGFVDDMKGLGYKTKFAGQILAAVIIVVFGGVRIDSMGSLLPGGMQLPGWFSFPFTLVAIVGVTNAVNMADGLDGLAGGISLLVLCCIGYLAHIQGNTVVILLSLALAGAIFGFLRYNTYPANIFMGDTGSQLLGFASVVLAMKVTQGDTPFSPVLPLIILGFPILDTLTVMAERIREGRSPFSPDKNHFHHRLMGLGLSHTEAVFAIYLVQAAMIVSAILFKYYSDWALVISYAVFSAVVISAFAVAGRKGYRFSWHPVIGQMIRGRLRRIRDDNWITRISFALSSIIVPVLLLLSCLLPANIPGYVSFIAVCFSLLIVAVRLLWKGQMGFCLRFVVYLTVPLVLYLIREGRGAWHGEIMFTLYHLSFGLTALFVLLSVKYANNTKAFRMTTMDFLVIFIAVVVPNLPDQSIQNYHLGLLAVEIIVLLFSYEVLITERRGRLDALTASTLLALTLLAIRGGAGL
ncbi:MAG TPA: MraY family glycosyltransferase [Thermodesulfovibrionales bacterium]|jgi:UDP-GlcNAc:undecaprenyl-phosphate GlcNAc-1-phosphate transferase|nr:MraY family glycosyltransferase [Thermodesulfovibrionales bacterium]